MNLQHNWTLNELTTLYHLPLLELLSKSHHIHTQFHHPAEIQVCHLISIKTGGCPEDCKYCAQSSRYQTPVSAQPMMRYEEVLEEAKRAAARGATRVCLGAAWKEARDSDQFEEVLRMIRGITDLGVEVCCTLGRLKPHQAKRLKEAGLYSYNHNLDTSERFYKTIISTRTYEQRMETLDTVQQANLGICCGGILGMGESVQDRLELLLTLSRRNPHPDSVPINILSPIPGTPLGNRPKTSLWELLPIIAIARIAVPKAMVRLSSGRIDLSFEEQALCFFAGANSIFSGEKLLTIANTPVDQDAKLFKLLGIRTIASFSKGVR